MSSGAQGVAATLIRNGREQFAMLRGRTPMREPIDPRVAAILFEEARTHQAWTTRPAPDDLLIELYRRLRWAPTSINSNPGRFLFVKSPEAKRRLAAHLKPTNVEKALAAPVCAIVAKDARFYDLMPQLLPGRPVKAVIEATRKRRQRATQLYREHI